MTTLLLTKEQVRGLMRMPDVIDAVEEAFRAFNSDQVEQPDYMGLHLPSPGAEIDFKAACHRAGGLVSLKASSGGFKDNPSRFGLPNGMGTVLLFDARSGALVIWNCSSYHFWKRFLEMMLWWVGLRMKLC